MPMHLEDSDGNNADNDSVSSFVTGGGQGFVSQQHVQLQQQHVNQLPHSSSFADSDSIAASAAVETATNQVRKTSQIKLDYPITEFLNFSELLESQRAGHPCEGRGSYHAQCQPHLRQRRRRRAREVGDAQDGIVEEQQL